MSQHGHLHQRSIPTGVGEPGYQVYRPTPLKIEGANSIGLSPQVWGSLEEIESLKFSTQRSIPTGVGEPAPKT